jgi:O-antigen ligase
MYKILYYSSFIFLLILWTYAIPELRILKQPLPIFILSIIFLLIFLVILISKKIPNYSLFKIVIFCIITLITSFIFSTYHNSVVLFTYTSFLIFFYLIYHIFYSFKNDKLLSIFFYTSLLIFLYGLYGYFNWSIGDFNQHLFGYFGVSYLASTRNGDTMYLFVPFWYTLLSFLNKKATSKLAFFSNILILITISAAIVLTFARGAWISIILTLFILLIIIIILNKKSILINYTKLFVGLSFCITIIFIFSPIEIKKVVQEKFISIISPESVTVSSSNYARADLINSSFGIFMDNPIFGIGVGTTSNFIKYNDGSTANHSENLFLTILVETGILGLIPFLFLHFYYFYLIHYSFKSSLTFNNLFSFCIFLTLFIYGFFNLMIDSLWYWSLMGISYGLISKSTITNFKKV